jgi:hypothetical protein
MRESLCLWFMWAFLPHVALLLKHLAVVRDQSVMVPQCSAKDLPVDVGLLLSSCPLTIKRCLVKDQYCSVMVEHELLVVHQASMMIYDGLLVVLKRLRGVPVPIASKLGMAGLLRLVSWFLHRSSSLSAWKRTMVSLACSARAGESDSMSVRRQKGGFDEFPPHG